MTRTKRTSESSSSAVNSARERSKSRDMAYYMHVAQAGLADWPEIELALRQAKKELVLAGPFDKASGKQSKRDSKQVPDELFSCTELNFLEISHTELLLLSPKVAQLDKIVNLVLRHNHLTLLPPEIGELKQLQLFDVSDNNLQSLPEEIGTLENITTLNLAGNQITAIPNLSRCLSLAHFIAGRNKLTQFPIQSSDLKENADIFALLADVDVSKNEITSVPAEIKHLQVLRSLNLSDNQLSMVPRECGQCPRIKEIFVAGNNLKDRRLVKLVSGSHVKMPAVLDYIRTNCDSAQTASAPRANPHRSRSRSRAAEARTRRLQRKQILVEKAKNGPDFEARPKIIVRTCARGTQAQVTRTEMVDQIRPHIVCCIVRDIHLDVDGRFKKFLNVQTKLHESDAFCKRRVAATIATHDLDKIKLPLTFTALAPHDLKIVPLGSASGKTELGMELVARLVSEADAIRKKEKRNQYSGVYKYLNLVKPMQLYPATVDSKGTVISFAPVTNSQCSKMHKDTKNLFIEVSSSESLAVCKRVMDKLVHEMVMLELGKVPTASEAENANAEHSSKENLDDSSGSVEEKENLLNVDQIRVVNENGQLKVAYPDRLDLAFEDADTHRE